MTEFNKAFIDTSLFIFLLEHNPQYYDKANKFFTESYSIGKMLATSTVTIEEYCVQPYRTNETVLIDKFFQAISALEVEISDISKPIALKAAQIRAKYKSFKAMDALQLAAAITNGCDLFLTNDKQLKQFEELRCLTLEDFDV